MKQNFMAHKSSYESDDQIPSQPLDAKTDLHPSENQEEQGYCKDATQQEEPSASNTNKDEISLLEEQVSVPEEEAEAEEESKESGGDEVVVVVEDSGRERLKRHRVEVAGRVWIPEIWGQEDLLKDWIDCNAFDAPLVPSRITTARAALVQQDRTRSNAAAAGVLRIENRC